MKISSLLNVADSELHNFRVGSIRSSQLIHGPIDFKPYECVSLKSFQSYAPRATDSQLLRIKNGIFIGGTQNVISLSEGVRFGLPTVDHVHNRHDDWPSRYASQYDLLIPREAISLGGKTLLLKGTWSSEFYHFLTETLGKLLVANVEIPLTEFDHIIIDGTEKPFVRQWMEVLDIKSETLKDFGCVPVIAEELFVPTYLAPCAATAFELIQFINQSIAKPAKRSFGSRGQKIYISRRGKRKVLCEEYLLDDCLHFAGVKKVNLEDFDIFTQAEIVRDAELIIGPHGAGLANLIYSKATIFELVGDHYNNPCYADMATACGNNYFYHVCRELGGDLIVNSAVIQKFISTFKV